MEAGVLVRLKSDPGRKGLTTGKTRERAGRLLIQVRFPNSVEYIPKDQLEIPPKRRENPLDLLDEGRLGLARDLRRAITHVRLSGRLANLIYSMEITNTDFYAYQFKPVLKLLNSATNGILIADEVGLGKTIEAGLIWTELRSRYDFRRLLVLCPAVLREKWRMELQKRFGIDAQILDAAEAHNALMDASRDGIYASFAIISSMQGLRPRKGWDKDDNPDKMPASILCRYLKDQELENPLVDLLIIDEAHKLRNPERKTAALGRLLRKVSDYTALLSATPVHLRSSDLYQLINLVDEDTFNHPAEFENILSANAPLTTAREKVLSQKLSQHDFLDLLKKAKEHPLLQKNRQLKSLIDSPPSSKDLEQPEKRSLIAGRLDTMNILGHVVTRTRKREVKEWSVIRQPFAEKIPLTDPERIFYENVTNMVRGFCTKYDRHEGFLLVTPQLQMCSSMPAALREWQQRKELYIARLNEEEDYDSEEDDSFGPLIMEIIDKVDQLGNLPELWENDSKFNRFNEVLQKLLKDNSIEKIIVFSRFRATLEYLNERLSKIGIPSILMMGGKEFDKDAIVKEFGSPDGPNILLSSEVGSEGIDLQFCHLMVNYDLPWNPMKVEQRIGRIDRIGQKAERVLIWNLFYRDTIDGRLYTRLLDRLHIFEYALGGLEPVIGEEIEKLTYELLSKPLTPEQEIQRIDQTAVALETNQRIERELEEEAGQLVAYGDYILNQIQAARELNRWIDARDIQIYITDFFSLHYPGCQFKQLMKDQLDFEIRLSNEAKYDLEKFLKDTKLVGSTVLTRNDPTPVRCRFENKLAGGRSHYVEIINQVHPLIRFVTHNIDKNEEYSYPAVSIKLNSKHLPSEFEKVTYVFTIQKWTVRGIQEMEQLYFAAIPLGGSTVLLSEKNSERLALAGAVHGEDWLEARNLVSLELAVVCANEHCLAYSDQRYAEYVAEMQNRNADRADIQEKTLERHLKNQLDKLLIVKAKHAQFGRESLAKATEGKIIALKNRVERKRIEIQKRRELNVSKDEICVGIVKVI
jgi:superfamily II DNA or RNA helicase